VCRDAARGSCCAALGTHRCETLQSVGIDLNETCKSTIASETPLHVFMLGRDCSSTLIEAPHCITRNCTALHGAHASIFAMINLHAALQANRVDETTVEQRKASEAAVRALHHRFTQA
jgi:hypothetical protein|tara:strand:+ start:1096 stop:1449 length:354 start_codon:yes stop_codon:yes gene_type:complete